MTSIGRDLIAYNWFFQIKFLTMCLCLFYSTPFHCINPNHEYITDLSPVKISDRLQFHLAVSQVLNYHLYPSQKQPSQNSDHTIYPTY